jgi:hypothetical protein
MILGLRITLPALVAGQPCQLTPDYTTRAAHRVPGLAALGLAMQCAANKSVGD